MKAKLYTCSFLLSFLCLSAFGSVDTIKPGSYIVDMGVMPQTIGNGLKPYGLVYDLLKNYNTPVKWVMNSGKSKDGIDFVHNGITYRGGAFIIDAEFRTSTINAVIAGWEAQGVIGHTSVSEFTIEVPKILTYGPNWTMDKTNGHLAVSYFTNAGIPASAYGGDSSNWKSPSELGACDDIFVLPHADPTWATHSNLYYWNLNHKGSLWVACHAVSAIENLSSPDNSIRTNFLSTEGLVETSLHKRHSTPPFAYDHHGDFVMQFLGTLDSATANGSERSFLPIIGGSWRTSTKLGVYDTVDTYIPSLSAGPAAVVAYGRAYGDENRGWVMYEAGHNHDESGTLAEKIAAQRAFFNYSFFVAAERYANFQTSISGIGPVMTTGVPVNLSVEVPAWVDLSKYTIEWTSSRGGAFSPANGQSVTFTPPLQTGQTIITVTLTDECDRAVFSTQMSFITGILSSVSSLQGKYVKADKKVLLNWQRADEEVSYYQIERRSANGDFVKIGKVTSDNTTNTYRFEDLNPGNGTVYYRLAFYSASGNVKYSNMITVDAMQLVLSGLQTVVNPARGQIIFDYVALQQESVSIMVFDMHGKQLAVKNNTVQPGRNILEIGSQTNWPKGIYLLRVASNNSSTTKRVYFTP